MRTFRHLTRSEIADIVHSHSAGEKQADLARRFSVDHSTINYHVAKYERAYPEEGGVYSLIKVEKRKVCIHPSGRCTICGEMWDELRRVEREAVRTLTQRLDRANASLRVSGFPVE